MEVTEATMDKQPTTHDHDRGGGSGSSGGINFFSVRQADAFLKLFTTETLTRIWQAMLRSETAGPAPPARRSDLIAGLTKLVERDGHRHLAELPRVEVLRSLAATLGLPLAASTAKRVECKKRLLEYLDDNGLDFMLDRLGDTQILALSDALGIVLATAEGATISRQQRCLSICAAVNSAGLHAFMDPLLSLPLFKQMAKEARVPKTTGDNKKMNRREMLLSMLTDPDGVPQEKAQEIPKPTRADDNADTEPTAKKQKTGDEKPEEQTEEQGNGSSTNSDLSTAPSEQITGQQANVKHFRMFALVKNETTPTPAPTRASSANMVESSAASPAPVQRADSEVQQQSVEQAGNTEPEKDTTTSGAGKGSIHAILSDLGLREYIPLFEKEEIDIEALVLLEEDHLKLLGLPIGPRVKLLRKIALLKQAPEEMTTSPSQEVPPKQTARTPNMHRRRRSALQELLQEKAKLERREESRKRRRSGGALPPLPQVEEECVSANESSGGINVINIE